MTENEKTKCEQCGKERVVSIKRKGHDFCGDACANKYFEKRKNIAEKGLDSVGMGTVSGMGIAEEAFKYGGRAAKWVGNKFTKHAAKAAEGLSKAAKLAKVGSKMGQFTQFMGKLGGFLGPLGGIASFFADRAKDAMIESRLSGLATEIGDVRDGLNNVQNQLEDQGRALEGQINDVKSELEGAIQQQGQKFDQELKDLDKKLETATGANRQAIEEEVRNRKREIAEVRQELESQIREVTENLTRAHENLKRDLEDFKSEVNERFEKQERKIIENKRRIEEEKRQREAEVKEIKDKIKINQTNLENLREEKNELSDNFDRYKSQIDQKTAEIQQVLEDTQAEYERKTKIIEAQIKDNEETLEEFSEELINTQREQARQRIQQEEIIENLQETNDILFTQQRKLNLVAEQMDDIQEEVHQRMDKLSEQLETRTQETLKIAEQTNQKIDNLTEEVKNIRQESERLQEEIKKNKELTEEVKKEAQWANERLDNYIKAQKLLDFSAQQSQLNKIQKSLELKAEEAKLLATLNLLQETKKLIRMEPAEIEWKVGVKTGTAPLNLSETEGYALAPNSYWEKRYTGDQVKPDNPHSLFTPEWFNWEQENYLPPEQTKFEPWGTRIKTDNESALLTDPERRTPKEIQKTKQEEKEAAGEETQQAELSLEKLEELKSETLSRLQEIQSQVKQNLAQAKEETTTPKPKSSAKYSQPLSAIQQKIQQAKQKITDKKEAEWEARQKIKSQPTKKNAELAQAAQQETKQAEQELTQFQEELASLQTQQEFEANLEKFEEEATEKDQAEIEQQWATIQDLSQQALQEDKKEEEKPEQTKEEELDKKLEELTQQLKEMEQSAAASQKTMTMFMLFLIIFLLEYVVYKRNGLPGLVVLNIILAIAYYYRNTLKEYSELWGKYLLILGYVMGNVLAYSAPEQQKYKWPCVIGFNLAILGIYGYTLYQQKKEETKLADFYQKKTKEICEENKVSKEEWANIQQTSTKPGGMVDEYNIFSTSGTEIRTEQLANLKEVIHEKEAAQQKEQELQKQAETLQQAAEIEAKLKQAQANLSNSSMTWTEIKTKYPDFAHQSLFLKEIEKADRVLSQETESTKSLTKRLARIPAPSPEEQELLSQLYLTAEQFNSISQQSQYLTREEKELVANNYLSLTSSQKLQLLNAGLNNLGVDTLKKKENLVELNHQLVNEKSVFGLAVKEKENVLRLLVNTLNLTLEQRTALEEAGISFFDATNWQVSEEQKENLLSFGLNKIELTKEQEKILSDLHPDSLKTFAFSEEQKNILQSLAPLTQEYKYSSNSLNLLKNLVLKPNHLAFFAGEEILPNPNLDFGETKSPYLPLKLKFLQGEQTALKKQAEEAAKKVSEEEMVESKNSILNSLLELASKKLTNSYFLPWKLENKPLSELNFSLEEWVNLNVLKGWQRDILLTLGLKTIPNYHFFELLIFAIEEISNQSWNNFLKENPEYSEPYEKYLEHQRNQPITINKTNWEKYVSSQTSRQKEIFANLNLEELINQQIKSSLSEYKFSQETFYDSAEELETEEPQSSTSRYDNLFDNLNTEEANRQKKKKEREDARKKLEDQEHQRREAKLSEKDRKLKEDEERRQKERELAEQEEAKREEARQAREKALQAEQDAYFTTKSKNLAERKKVAEEALANQKKENELEEKKRQAEIEKMKQENETEQNRLAEQAKDIEKKKQEQLAQIALEDEEERQLIEKRANEEKLRIQKEIDERKRKDEEELKKKENQLLKERQTRELEIAKMEEERKLAEEEERTNAVLFEQEQKTRAATEAQKAAALRVNTQRMDAQRRSEAIKDNNIQTALNSILWYPMLNDEWNRCVQGGSHFDKCPTVEDGFSRYPGLRVNPGRFQFDSGKWTNNSGGRWTYSRADDLKHTVGMCKDNWFTKQELEKFIKDNITEKWLPN